jgi:hypothetical protein
VSAPSPGGRAPRRGVTRHAAVLAVLAALVLTLLASAPAGAAEPAPLPGGSESADGAWAVVPMGQLSDLQNTFWQLLRGHPGSSAWSVVTPEGVADNGGIVATASGAEVMVGFLPSQQLRFSPLSVSEDGGTSWSPAYLPGALPARPDALALNSGTALAIVGTRVLRASPTLPSWSPVVSLARLRTTGAGCGPGALNAVAFAPSGTPIVGTSCRRGGRVGLFTRSSGRWTPAPVALTGRLRRATTSVLTLSSGTGVTTALVSARGPRGTDVLALWRSAAGAWSASAPLPLPAGASVRAAADGVGGALTVLIAGKHAPAVYQASPMRPWTRFPAPPAGTVAIASTVPSPPVLSVIAADAFVVKGTELRVYALTPAGTSWALAQTTQVPLAYGSSS